MLTRRNILISVGAMIIAAFAVGAIFAIQRGSIGGAAPSLDEKPRRIITDNIVLPDTKKIAIIDGRMNGSEAFAMPFDPSASAQIDVPQARLTARGVYDRAVSDALSWEPDARLVFIKSLGTVTISGRATAWQIVFGSEKKKKTFEILFNSEKIASEKEIDGSSVGHEFPKEWYDSDEAIRSVQNLPQFQNATLTALNFFYNTDAKEWRYGLVTSAGNTSMRVK